MSDTIRLTNQSAHPVRNDGGVDWHTEVLLTGTFIVVGDVIDKRFIMTVTSVRGSGEWAIKHEDLPNDSR